MVSLIKRRNFSINLIFPFTILAILYPFCHAQCNLYSNCTEIEDCEICDYECYNSTSEQCCGGYTVCTENTICCTDSTGYPMEYCCQNPGICCHGECCETGEVCCEVSNFIVPVYECCDQCCNDGQSYSGLATYCCPENTSCCGGICTEATQMCCVVSGFLNTFYYLCNDTPQFECDSTLGCVDLNACEKAVDCISCNDLSDSGCGWCSETKQCVKYSLSSYLCGCNSCLISKLSSCPIEPSVVAFGFIIAILILIIFSIPVVIWMQLHHKIPMTCHNCRKGHHSEWTKFETTNVHQYCGNCHHHHLSHSSGAACSERIEQNLYCGCTSCTCPPNGSLIERHIRTCNKCECKICSKAIYKLDCMGFTAIISLLVLILGSCILGLGKYWGFAYQSYYIEGPILIILSGLSLIITAIRAHRWSKESEKMNKIRNLDPNVLPFERVGN